MITTPLLLASRPGWNDAMIHGGHGSLQPGMFDWLVVGAAVGVVLLVFGLCARYFLVPGETSPSHIKRRILE